MAIVGRWPRAVFYDSKTTLFNWAGSWRGAAAQLLKRHGADVAEQQFVETWVRAFEGLHRRAAFFRYTQVTDIVREALLNAYKMHGIRGGGGEDVDVFLELQEKVELFPDTEPALLDQQALGVKVLIYSDVETKYLEMYVAKFKKFKPDFLGTTEQAGVAKPNPRTYQWVLRKTGLEARDVLYCAAPMFDVQGAMSAGMIAAWLRRPEGRLSKETHTAGDLAADFEVESLHDVTRILNLNRSGGAGR
jgi:FMN phosphatase YigB (HAD superfamily)